MPKPFFSRLLQAAKYVCIGLLGLWAASCATLSKSQISEVQQFASVSKGFSAYPSKILTELVEVRVKRSAYYAMTLSDPKLHLAQLDSIQKQREFDRALPAKVDVTFQILDTYAQGLLLLSDDTYSKNVDTHAQGLGTNLDSLVARYNAIEGARRMPTGLGGGVSKLILLGGKQYIRTRQAKEINKFVTAADTLVGLMARNLIHYLSSGAIQELIQGEERAIGQSYLAFLRVKQTPPSENTVPLSEVSVDNEMDYLSLKDKIFNIKQLQKQTIEATKALRTAHAALAKSVTTKKKLKEIGEELQVLGAEVNDVRAALQKIEKQQ